MATILAGRPGPITAFQKSYNPSSNPLANGRGDRFRYDDEGQLVEGWYGATNPSVSGAGNLRYDSFSYDALGNRMGSSYVANRGSMNFVRKDNGLNQYRAWWPYSYTNYDDDIGGTWGAPGAANGVLMQDGNITAGFNALNQPMLIQGPANAGTANWMYFGYDPLGRCVKRWVSDSGDVYSNPATYFHYDGWNLLQEGNNAWGPARVYAHGNRMDEIVWSYNTFTGQQAFHHYDARGHCTLLTDSGGNILEQYEYDAFGRPYYYDAAGNSIGTYDQFGILQGYSIVGNRFLFTGREWLSDLRLYDFRNRMYQPELGRFLQPDPKEFGAGDYNLYRYCHNDPINRSDPFGLLEANHEDKELAKPILVSDTYRKFTGSNIPVHIRVFNSGNWNDRTIANHETTNLERDTGYGGLTKPSGSSDVSGSNVDINLHVDWYWDSKYAGTDVITRELQHVQDARTLGRGFGDGSRTSFADFRSFQNVVRGFNTMQKNKYEGLLGNSHDLKTHPAIPTTVPECDDTY